VSQWPRKRGQDEQKGRRLMGKEQRGGLNAQPHDDVLPGK